MHKISDLLRSLTFQQLTRGTQITFKSKTWKLFCFQTKFNIPRCYQNVYVSKSCSQLLGRSLWSCFLCQEEEYSWCRLGPAQLPPLKITLTTENSRFSVTVPSSFFLESLSRACLPPSLLTHRAASAKHTHFPGLPEAEESSLKVLSSVQACEKSELWKTNAVSDLEKGMLFFFPHFKKNEVSI